MVTPLNTVIFVFRGPLKKCTVRPERYLYLHTTIFILTSYVFWVAKLLYKYMCIEGEVTLTHKQLEREDSNRYSSLQYYHHYNGVSNCITS